MKKLMIGTAVLAIGAAAMAGSSDPVLMKIAGKDVRLSEFEYLYHKNNTQQLQPQSLEDYVEMFVNYKLKVADAEAAGLDTTAAFITEYGQFRDELAAPYLVDQAVEDSLVAESYEHMLSEVLVSHIMMYDGAEAVLDSLRTAILSGSTTFEDVAARYSIDKPSAVRGGLMGVVTPNRYPWAFEQAAYNTEVGGISPVINSGFGIHIIRVEERVAARGEVLVEHILRLTRNVPDSVAAEEAARIDSIYTVVTTPGVNFGEVATRLSQDPGSARRGGQLDWFGAGMMVAEFDSVAFALADGEYSKPFRTSYGWHIIHKLASRGVGTLEENKAEILAAMARDDRGVLPRQQFVNSQIAKYKGSFYDANIESFGQRAEEYGQPLDSTLRAEFAQSNLPIFRINGKDVTMAELVPTLPISAVSGSENVVAFIRRGAMSLMGQKAMEYAREDLAVTNADYRNLINEYRDGILLFEISNRNVWDRAAKDTEGLEAFFNANREKYQWSEPKFKSFIFFASTDSLVNAAVAYAATVPTTLSPADFTAVMRERFGKDLKIERVIAAKGENAITDYLAFGGEKPEAASNRWGCYAPFNGRVLDAPEEAADCRGLVVADYQAFLEAQWVAQLRTKYKVKINRKVLQQVQ